jgi:hypothetical protein
VGTQQRPLAPPRRHPRHACPRGLARLLALTTPSPRHTHASAPPLPPDIDEYYRKKDPRPLVLCNFARGLADKTYDEVRAPAPARPSTLGCSARPSAPRRPAGPLRRARLTHLVAPLPRALQVSDYQHLYKVLTEALMEYNETNAGGAAGLRAGGAAEGRAQRPSQQQVASGWRGAGLGASG